MKQATSHSGKKTFADKVGARFGRFRKESSHNYVVRSDSFMVFSFNNPHQKRVAKNPEKKTVNNNTEILPKDVTLLENTVTDLKQKELCIVEEEEIVPEIRILEGELDSTVVHVTKDEDLKLSKKSSKSCKK